MRFQRCAATLQLANSASAAALANLDLVFLAGGPLFPSTLLPSKWATSFVALLGAWTGLVGGLLCFDLSTLVGRGVFGQHFYSDFLYLVLLPV